MPGLLISLFASLLLILSGKAISHSADLDHGENETITAPTTIFWQNGTLGPSGAHFAQNYSMPYPIKIVGLTGGKTALSTVVIQWEVNDQNGHTQYYITRFDNIDNQVGSHQANFCHSSKSVNRLLYPPIGTTYVLADAVEVEIPTPSPLANPGDNSIPCLTASTINQAVTTNAGADQTVCLTSPNVTLAGSVSGGATTGTWSSSGTGTFAPNAMTLSAVYIPSQSDIYAGRVTLTLTSTNPDGLSNATTDQMDIYITANPSRPKVIYLAPDSNEDGFSMKVIGAVAGGAYTLTQVNGVGNVVKTTAVDKDPDNNILFDGLAIGKGFSIVLLVGDCSSTATDCDNYKDDIIIARKPLTNPTTNELGVTEMRVTAAPNPFNEKIRFSITPTVTGRASLELYNLLGEKVKTVFVGHVQKGQVQTIEYNVPFSQRTTLIYMYRSGNEKISGKLIGLR